MTADISELENRVAALELGKQYDATKEAVQNIEKEFLLKLREIKSQLESEGVSNANTKEMETLRAENEELKRKNAKLEYRVEHLVASLEKYYKCNPDAM